jgi:NtrZ
MKRMQSILAILAFSVFAGPVMSDEVTGARAADSSLPWNRAFTVRDETRDEGRAALPIRTPGVAIPANSKWGVTVNFDIKDSSFENMDRMSAGAYFDLSPRIRLGGSLSFGAPGDLRVSTPRDHVLPSLSGEKDSAIRIESSIKF